MALILGIGLLLAALAGFLLVRPLVRWRLAQRRLDVFRATVFGGAFYVALHVLLWALLSIYTGVGTGQFSFAIEGYGKIIENGARTVAGWWYLFDQLAVAALIGCSAGLVGWTTMFGLRLGMPEVRP